MQDLFSTENSVPEKNTSPLAFRMRPANLDEFIGQESAVGKNSFLRKSLMEGKVPSLIFWGPPGSGKTTLAMIIAGMIKAEFVTLSAVSSGVKDVKAVVDGAKFNRRSGKSTILFVDEIHRFNKAQQDAFLPNVEDGTITLIGATTENPSFEVISALLSRARVIKLEPLDEGAIKKIIENAISDRDRGLGNKKISIEDKAVQAIDAVCSGDARTALNLIEMIDDIKNENSYEITVEDVKVVAERKTFLYDKNGEEHYNIISAFHKSLRDSDPDGALYWLTRMIDAGEDPLYITRRIVRFASEDIGNADTNALAVALNAKEAYHFLGSPEGELAIAQAVLYLAAAPKSNAAYSAYSRACHDVRNTRDEPVPLHLRNAPTGLMKKAGYGRGYKYAHDYAGNFVKQEHLPDKLKNRKYYEPTDNGFEKEIKERIKKWREG